MKVPIKLLTLILALASMNALIANTLEEKPLFDGKTLNGWTALPSGTWTVENGAIVGKSPKSEHRHGMLLSDRQYSDFVVTAKFRVLSGDSGFYFRSERVASNVSVNGFQVEVDRSQETGGLYETGGRAWVHQPSEEIIGKRGYKPGEWTTLELQAVGRDLEVKINGVVTSTLTNDKGRLKGHFGLQLHGGQDMHVEFKDIAISEITTGSGFEEMFNGKDLTGWKTKGNWVVEKENVITLNPRPGESGWQRYDDYLATEKKYRDFVLDLEFKFEPTGNSGVFMRIGDLKNHVTNGFEIQILDTHNKKKFGAHDCGGVIGTSAPKKMVVKPAGEWNRYLITLKGSLLKVVLNDVLIQDLDLSTTGLKERPMKGHISFQDEAKRVSYRNVRIKELN
ncbi:MAG: hypothetical protein ACJAVK_001834 [Akkermansiaceae bacterium]|jgi:hypothetical protein